MSVPYSGQVHTKNLELLQHLFGMRALGLRADCLSSTARKGNLTFKAGCVLTG